MNRTIVTPAPARTDVVEGMDVVGVVDQAPAGAPAAAGPSAAAPSAGATSVGAPSAGAEVGVDADDGRTHHRPVRDRADHVGPR